MTIETPRPALATEARAEVKKAERKRRSITIERAAMAGATAFLSINLWTGSPLLALWLGSQVAEQQALSFKPILVVILSLTASTLAISVALGWLESRYRQLVGMPLREGRLTWLRAFNAQREPVRHVPTSALERIVTIVVYIAVIVFVVWFLFFAGSPLPSSYMTNLPTNR